MTIRLEILIFLLGALVAQRMLQNGPHKCTSDASCFFGGSCNTATGVCSCPSGFVGNLCTDYLFSVCGQAGQFPVLQKESPAVIPVVCQACASSCFMCDGTTSSDCI